MKSSVSLKDALHHLEGFLQTSNVSAGPFPAGVELLFAVCVSHHAWAASQPSKSTASLPQKLPVSTFWNGPGRQEMLPLHQNTEILNGNIGTTNTLPFPGTSLPYLVTPLIGYFWFINIICRVPATVESIHQIKSKSFGLWLGFFWWWWFFFFFRWTQHLVIILPITGGNPICWGTMLLLTYLLFSCCSSNSSSIFALSYNCSWIWCLLQSLCLQNPYKATSSCYKCKLKYL